MQRRKRECERVKGWLQAIIRTTTRKRDFECKTHRAKSSTIVGRISLAAILWSNWTNTNMSTIWSFHTFMVCHQVVLLLTSQALSALQNGTNRNRRAMGMRKRCSNLICTTNESIECLTSRPGTVSAEEILSPHSTNPMNVSTGYPTPDGNLCIVSTQVHTVHRLRPKLRRTSVASSY